MARARQNKRAAGRTSKSSAQRKLEEMRREQRARTITIRALAAAGTVIVVAAVVTVIALTAGGGGGHGGAAGSPGPEGVLLETGAALAPASAAATGQTVDGISCNTSEQAVYHIHAHLAVYVDGIARQVPLGIGTVGPSVSQTAQGGFASATRCYYWLHTHAADGIIHIESPVQRTYTLGNFFDIWRQPLTRGRVGPADGVVTAYLNGARFSGDPRTIPLTSRAAIQLDVGTQVPPKPLDWSKAQL